MTVPLWATPPHEQYGAVNSCGEVVFTVYTAWLYPSFRNARLRVNRCQPVKSGEDIQLNSVAHAQWLAARAADSCCCGGHWSGKQIYLSDLVKKMIASTVFCGVLVFSEILLIQWVSSSITAVTADFEFGGPCECLQRKRTATTRSHSTRSCFSPHRTSYTGE